MITIKVGEDTLTLKPDGPGNTRRSLLVSAMEQKLGRSFTPEECREWNYLDEIFENSFSTMITAMHREDSRNDR